MLMGRPAESYQEGVDECRALGGEMAEAGSRQEAEQLQQVVAAARTSCSSGYIWSGQHKADQNPPI